MERHVKKGFALLLICTLLVSGCTVRTPQDGKGSMKMTDKVLTEQEKSDFEQREHRYMQFAASSDSEATAEPTRIYEDGSFFDDFADGVNPTLWEIVHRQWGAGNNGVIPENVGYTDNGILVLTAHGDYYQGTKRTGACIASKANLGPGSYEVRMKCLPKFGVCTAMWTYYFDGIRNHEIDIELPAEKETFKNTLFTNWLNLTGGQTSQKVKPDFYHSDGRWHTYRFDWHTDPSRIDYYVDGVLTATANTNVPTVATNFWVGEWFPDIWCGTPDFDSAYMLVDWVKYEAYDEPHEVSENPFPETPAEQYPTAPMDLPINNFIENGDFSIAEDLWFLQGRTARIQDPISGSYMLRLGNEQALAENEQCPIHLNPGEEYLFTATSFAEKEGSKAKIELYFEDDWGNVLENTEIEFENTAFEPKSIKFTVPENAYYMRIRLSGEGAGKFYFEDLYITQPTRNDLNYTIS